jgi:hypothetical protein
VRGVAPRYHADRVDMREPACNGRDAHNHGASADEEGAGRTPRHLALREERAALNACIQRETRRTRSVVHTSG